MHKPLCIDLFCGLGGFSQGFLAEGYECIGFDLERHDYGTGGYQGQLVLQDVLTLDGAQFREADILVASPPCQEFSYMAMPFSRGKQIARALRGLDEFPKGYTGSRTVAELTALFDSCFRIQKQASIAAGSHIPLIVENVRGAQPWVGAAAYNYGSFYLFGGDVPALMPTAKNMKGFGGTWLHNAELGTTNPNRSRTTVDPGRKVPGLNFHEHEKTGKPGRSFQSTAVEGTKNGNDWFGYGENCSLQRRASSKSSARKRASAEIAKIPFALSSWIAQVYRPVESRRVCA